MFQDRVFLAAAPMTVGVFDSGLGGVSVLARLMAHFPGAHFIYYGDTANAPYGDKDPVEVCRLTHAAYRFFQGRGAAAMVIACNSATSAGAASVRQIASIPVFGIEPAVKSAVENRHHTSIVILATAMTIRGQKFQQLVARFPDAASRMLTLPCPGLADLVEAADFEGCGRYLRERLVSHVPDSAFHGAAFVLGCTHYSFLKQQLRDIIGPEAVIYDGNDGLARHLRQHLEAHPTRSSPSDAPASVEFIFSSEPESKIRMARELLNGALAGHHGVTPGS